MGMVLVAPATFGAQGSLSPPTLHLQCPCPKLGHLKPPHPSLATPPQHLPLPSLLVWGGQEAVRTWHRGDSGTLGTMTPWGQ